MKVSSAEAEIKLKNSSRFTFLLGNKTVHKLKGGVKIIVPIITRNLSSPCITSHVDSDIMPLTFSNGTFVQLCSRAMASTFAGPSIAARQVLSANCAADFESARAAAEVEAKAAARAKSMNLRMTNDPCENRREGTCIHCRTWVPSIRLIRPL